MNSGGIGHGKVSNHSKSANKLMGQLRATKIKPKEYVDKRQSVGQRH